VFRLVDRRPTVVLLLQRRHVSTSLHAVVRKCETARFFQLSWQEFLRRRKENFLFFGQLIIFDF